MNEQEAARQRAIWEEWAHLDPLWIMAGTDRSLDDLMQRGIQEIDAVMAYVAGQAELSFERRVALDFGCGVGRLTQALCNHFQQVVGVDISPTMLDHAQRYNQFGDRCTYLTNGIGDDPLAEVADRTVDFVYSANALFCVPPELFSAYVRDFLRIVKPNGLIALQVGTPSQLKHMLREAFPEWLLLRWVHIRAPQLRRGPAFAFHSITPRILERQLGASGGRLVHVAHRLTGPFPTYFIRSQGAT